MGRSRRVIPREILGLIISKTSVSKDDIGAIRILDNYSFVQVRATVAELIIEALNGRIFRGRPLSVNYARTRKDEPDAGNGDVGNGDSGPDIERDGFDAEDEGFGERDSTESPENDAGEEDPNLHLEHDPEDQGDKENV
jgi:hypothetical protein